MLLELALNLLQDPTLGCCFEEGKSLAQIWTTPDYISVSEPSTVHFVLWTECGEYFTMLGSYAGYNPGIVLGPCELWIQYDWYTDWLLMNPNTNWLNPSYGQLKEGSINFANIYMNTTPLSPSFAGTYIYHTALLFDEFMNTSGVTNVSIIFIGL